MRKGYLIIASILILIVGGSIYMLQKDDSPSSVKDQLIVEVSAPLLVEKVKIEYGFNSLKRKNDMELFYNRERYSTLFDRELKDTLKTKYGENDFLVTYNEEYYLSFRQFKTWGKSSHSYNFLLHQEDSIPVLKVDIEGENEMRFDVPMIPISDAEFYVVNTPVDSAGAVYKFLKLAKPEISEEKKEKTKKEEEELMKKMNKLFQ